MPAFEVVTTNGNTIHVEHSSATPAIFIQAADRGRYLDVVEVLSIAGREPRRNPIAIAFHAIALVRPKNAS